MTPVSTEPSNGDHFLQEDHNIRLNVNPPLNSAGFQGSIHKAAQTGNEEDIHQLLENGADINATDSMHRTALFLAVMHGHRSIVKCLLANNANVNICSIEKETIVHVAALHGHTDILEDLLQNSDCKQLVYALDQQGRIPLHHAVCGDPKPNIVTLLIEQGYISLAEKCAIIANNVRTTFPYFHDYPSPSFQTYVNAQNRDDATPLHLAAQHGHVESAEVLLRNGARLDIISKSRYLPFDLAVRCGQDNFIRFLLTAPKMIEEAPKKESMKDVEGFYCKRLLEAKKEGALEEQILNLHTLSHLFVEKGKLIRGAQILNCALALLHQHSEDSSKYRVCPFKQYTLLRLEQIEAQFLESKGIKHSTKMPSLTVYRKRLQEIRNSCKEAHAKAQNITDILFTLTKEFKNLLSNLIKDIQKILGPPPVKWACMGMGSMSRDEMCPYSDVEFAFVIEEETTQAMDYFRTLSQILELRVINLGETKFPVFGDGYPSPTPDGFCLDTGGNTPLGVDGVYELIGTPTTLAQFQGVLWMERNIILPNAMSHVCLVTGEDGLLIEYNIQKKKVQESIDEQSKLKEKNYKTLAMRLLAGHIAEFSPNLSAEKEEIQAFGIKKELYRPIQEIIASLALFYQLKAKTTFKRIDELVKLWVFFPEGAKNLKIALSQVLVLRLEAHLFYQNEEEFLCHPELGKSPDPHIMYFDEKNLKFLYEIYKVLIPFHNCGKEFLISKKKPTFNLSYFYDNKLFTQGLAFDKVQQHDKALDAFQKAVSLDPNDEYANLLLGSHENRIGKSQSALSRNLKAVELFKQKYHDENHIIVSFFYMSIGSIYICLKEHDKALDYFQKVLIIQSQFLGENHPSLIDIYEQIGDIYGYLSDYKEQLKYLHKALQIRLQSRDKNHSDMAKIYDNIGDAYLSEDNGKALEYYLKVLHILLQSADENHPNMAEIYDKIGFAYYCLEDYDKAIGYFQKAFKIFCSIYKCSHPKILNCLEWISRVVKELPSPQREALKDTYTLCVETLGIEHELTKQLAQFTTMEGQFVTGF